MMIYGGDTFVDLDKAIKAAQDLDKFSVDVEGGFARVPPLEVVRALDDGVSQDIDTMERITRFSILKKKVTVFYGAEQVGSPFIMNGLEDDWSAFDVFEESPLALQFLMSLAMAVMLKKSMPRSKNTPVAAGPTAPAGN